MILREKTGLETLYKKPGLKMTACNSGNVHLQVDYENLVCLALEKQLMSVGSRHLDKSP
jgi:hypothetical protein